MSLMYGLVVGLVRMLLDYTPIYSTIPHYIPLYSTISSKYIYVCIYQGAFWGLMYGLVVGLVRMILDFSFQEYVI